MDITLRVDEVFAFFQDSVAPTQAVITGLSWIRGRVRTRSGKFVCGDRNMLWVEFSNQQALDDERDSILTKHATRLKDRYIDVYRSNLRKKDEWEQFLPGLNGTPP